MRIALDLRFVVDHFPGIGRYAYQLALALASSCASHEWMVIHAPQARNTRYDLARLLRMPGITAVEAPPARSLAGLAALPGLLRRLRADVYHTPYYLFPYAGLPCTTVVTLFDVIPRLFPHESSVRARVLFDLFARLALRSARRVVTTSSRSRDDITRLYGIPAKRIAIVSGAADQRFRPVDADAVTAVRARYRLPESYALCVSSDKPHKNLAMLARAWAMVERERRIGGIGEQAHANASALPFLVLAGQRDLQGVTYAASTVHDLGPVAEDDLPGLYGGALLFLYPSRYEGFGLPPLEAMACGAPVICSTGGSLPEVAGDAALLVDPDDSAAWVRAIGRALGDAGLRATLREAGLRRAATFTWRRAAEEMLAVYAGIV